MGQSESQPQSTTRPRRFTPDQVMEDIRERRVIDCSHAYEEVVGEYCGLNMEDVKDRFSSVSSRIHRSILIVYDISGMDPQEYSIGHGDIRRDPDVERLRYRLDLNEPKMYVLVVFNTETVSENQVERILGLDMEERVLDVIRGDFVEFRTEVSLVALSVYVAVTMNSDVVAWTVVKRLMKYLGGDWERKWPGIKRDDEQIRNYIRRIQKDDLTESEMLMVREYISNHIVPDWYNVDLSWYLIDHGASVDEIPTNLLIMIEDTIRTNGRMDNLELLGLDWEISRILQNYMSEPETVECRETIRETEVDNTVPLLEMRRRRYGGLEDMTDRI